MNQQDINQAVEALGADVVHRALAAQQGVEVADTVIVRASYDIEMASRRIGFEQGDYLLAKRTLASKGWAINCATTEAYSARLGRWVGILAGTYGYATALGVAA